MEPVYIVSATAVVFSIFAVAFVLRKRVTVNVYNVNGTEIKMKWCGMVTRNVLRLETDGESVIVSDELIPLHGQRVTVIVLPKDL